MWIKFRRMNSFRKALCEESSAALCNPGCGWYHIYTFTALPPQEKTPIEAEVWMDDMAREERLALVLIDISAFRAGAISEEALLRISEILDFFHRNRKQMILRFVYDTEGKSLIKEPLTLAAVKRHMEQAGGIVRRYQEDILVMQGIFVGNWGEMHGSKFSDDKSLCELMDALYRSTEGACFLAVRTPAQWRRIAGGGRTASGLRERLALFNDGMFGSPTDLGTYSTMDRIQAGEMNGWSRREELEWQKEELAFVPNGGEAVASEAPVGWLRAAEEMRMMHVSYLNSTYHQNQLEYWKRETVEEAGCWCGVSGYDYIGRHLGYRFVVRDVTEGKGKELYIKIENCGFGNLCREADCFLEVEEADGTMVSRRLDADPRKWMSGETVLLRTGSFLDEKHAEGNSIYLALRQKAGGKAIFFANRDAGERLKIGEFVNLQKTQ